MKITDVRKSLTRHKNKSYRRRPINAVTDIAIHHSATTSGSAEAYANYHVNNLGWCGIGYHFVIEQDGEIKHCNDLDVISYHVGNSNGFCIGICLTGNFTIQEPTKEQEAALRYLVNEYLPGKLPSLKNIKGHNEYPGYASKQCPSFDFRKVLKEVEKVEKDQASSWAESSWEKAISLGVTDGTNPQNNITREQVIVMLDRLGLLK